MANKRSQPFDRKGGTLAISRRMLISEAYTQLKPPEKVLMLLLHEQWRPDRLVAYGVREAERKIPCNIKTASKSFNKLQEAGFIVCVEQSLFHSRNGSKAREWRLTWMPYMGNTPTNEWEKWRSEN